MRQLGEAPVRRMGIQVPGEGFERLAEAWRRVCLEAQFSIRKPEESGVRLAWERKSLGLTTEMRNCAKESAGRGTGVPLLVD